MPSRGLSIKCERAGYGLIPGVVDGEMIRMGPGSCTSTLMPWFMVQNGTACSRDMFMTLCLSFEVLMFSTWSLRQAAC